MLISTELRESIETRGQGGLIDSVTDMYISESRKVVVGDSLGNIDVISFDGTRQTLKTNLVGDQNLVLTENDTLVSGNGSGVISVFKEQSNKPNKVTEVGSGAVIDMAAVEGEKVVVLFRKKVKILETEDVVGFSDEISIDGWISEMIAQPQADSVFIASLNPNNDKESRTVKNKVTKWNYNKGDIQQSDSKFYPITKMTASDKYVFVGQQDGTLAVLNSETMDKLEPGQQFSNGHEEDMYGDPRIISMNLFEEDKQQRLITASIDGVIKIWNIDDSGSDLHIIQMFEQQLPFMPMEVVRFSGQTIAVSSSEGINIVKQDGSLSNIHTPLKPIKSVKAQDGYILVGEDTGIVEVIDLR